MRELVFFFSGLFIGKVLCQECGGFLNDASGWITAPDSDGDGLYDNDADCYWVILPQNNSAVEIYFYDVDLQKDPYCIKDVLTIYDENLEYLLSVCEEAWAPSILAKSMVLHFRSDSDVSAGGFNISYRQVYGWQCGSTELYSPGSFSPLDADSDGFYDNDLFCNWDIKAVNNDLTIRLYFSQWDIAESANCTLDFLLIHDDDEAYGIYCGVYRPPLFTTTWVSLSATLFTTCCLQGTGFKALYTIQKEPCGQILVNKTGVIRPPDSDNDGLYDNYQNCWWAMVAPDHGIIEFEFLNIAIEFDENCKYDYIQIYDGELNASATIYWVCGYTPPPIVRTKSSILYVQFYTDSEQGDTGFTAEYRHAWPCGSDEAYNINQFGSVDTDADGFYDHNMDCIWFIRSFLSSRKIQVYLAMFDIPSSAGCLADNLQIYDDVESYGVFCGKDRPPLISTTERVLSVEFHSGCCLNGTGFLAVYSVQGECGGLLTDTSGVIQSHDKDNNDKYDNNANCWWGIVAPPNHTVEIEFLSMAIQDGDDCNHDYIQMYDGEISSSAALGYYCGYTLPPVLRSATNVFYLMFVSDAWITDYGFTANYTLISAKPCGTTEVSNVGILRSLDADADGFYDNNLTCVWHIHPFYRDRIINFYVTKYDIPTSNNCTVAYLKIYDDEQMYGIFCGANRPPLIKTTRAVLNIEFHSDCCGIGKGFEAVHTQEDGECGHILTQPTGVLQSIDRDNDGMYDANINCNWVLVAPDDGRIELTFLSFVVEFTEQCVKDSIAIFDGDIINDGGIGLCGALDEERVFLSTENVLFLKFKTDSEYQFAGWTAEYRHKAGTAQSTEQGTIESSSPTPSILISTFSNTVEASDKVATTGEGPTDRQTTGQETSRALPHETTEDAHTEIGTHSFVTDTQMYTNLSTTAISDLKSATTVTSMSTLYTESSPLPSKGCKCKLAFTCHLLFYSFVILFVFYFFN